MYGELIMDAVPDKVSEISFIQLDFYVLKIHFETFKHLNI